MSDTQFSTLLRLITELSDKIDQKIDNLRGEFKRELKKGFKKHHAECHEEHMEILKAIEGPFIEHERRITTLENNSHS